MTLVDELIPDFWPGQVLWFPLIAEIVQVVDVQPDHLAFYTEYEYRVQRMRFTVGGNLYPRREWEWCTANLLRVEIPWVLVRRETEPRKRS